MDHDTFKHQIEMAVVSPFLTYLRENGIDLLNPTAGRHTEDEPDVLCESANGRIGIEVACAFYNDHEAANVRALDRGEPEKSTRYWDPSKGPLKDFRQSGARSVDPAKGPAADALSQMGV